MTLSNSKLLALPLKTIVVLIALPEEQAAFQTIFPVKGDMSSDTQVRLEHASGRNDVRVISVLSEQMGAQSALFSADKALEDFKPDMVVVLGIAGGLSTDLRVGDVCVSNEIIDVLHNTKVTDKGKKTEITLAPDFYSIDAELVASFTFLKVHPGCSELLSTWKEAGSKDPEAVALGPAVSEMGPEFHIGPIACGPVVASEQFNEKLRSLHRKVTAIETESGGVFGRLLRSRIPAVAIRGISDLANSDKASLEKNSRGGARRLAMNNASRLLKNQILNDRFLNVVIRWQNSTYVQDGELFPQPPAKSNVVSDLDKEIRSRLAERSSEFRAKPDSFYLPIPRATKVIYTDDVAGNELESPINLVDCLRSERRILVRLPRSYPSQSLSWSLAHALLRQQIDDRVVLPYVISGEAINPPNKGLDKALPASFTAMANREEYVRLVIIEEPLLHARNRVKFLGEELSKIDASVMVITKAAETVSVADEFLKEHGFKEYELAPVSFSETAFFLEKAFDMTAREAESVAIRLDDTFRRFRLEAHPTYFAGIQEETLDALINANKRAELIQLAVDAVLSLMVAADQSIPPLSRTTRERFLRTLVLQMATGHETIDDQKLLDLATRFLSEGLLPTPALNFLRPFFDIGLLYHVEGAIFVTHPYLESYLLAQALREDQSVANDYFDPERNTFNYYAFDLYCEMGPSSEVIERVISFSNQALEEAWRLYPDGHIYLDSTQKLTAMSSPSQLRSLTSGLMKAADRIEKDEGENSGVRSEKQRLLDARRYVRKQVGERNPSRRHQSDLPDEIRKEFASLDALSRALTLTSIAVGGGSESLKGQEKIRLGQAVLGAAEKFSDIWTRNRLRVDFGELRNDILSDSNIWKVLEELGASNDDFDKVKCDLELLIHGFELNAILEPMARVLGAVSSTAGVRVLQPVLEQTKPNGQIQSLIRSMWMLDVNAQKGGDLLKTSLRSYHGSALMRVVLASHILWRAFWHHYKTPSAQHFISSAKRALRPLKLAPSQEQIDSIKKGPDM